MRNEILQLKDLGRMPNESINDTESIDELVNTYDALLEQIQLPISFDEAIGKSSVRCPLKPKRFYPLKIFNNAPSKSLDRWGYYYFSLFPSVCRHLPDTFSV